MATDNARNKCYAECRDIIKKADRVNWDMSTWKVTNNSPMSGDDGNRGSGVLSNLKDWITKRQFDSSLVAEDEVTMKAEIVLKEVIKTFILASQPATTGEALTVSLMDIAIPVDRKLTEGEELAPKEPAAA